MTLPHFAAVSNRRQKNPPAGYLQGACGKSGRQYQTETVGGDAVVVGRQLNAHGRVALVAGGHQRGAAAGKRVQDAGSRRQDGHEVLHYRDRLAGQVQLVPGADRLAHHAREGIASRTCQSLPVWRSARTRPGCDTSPAEGGSTPVLSQGMIPLQVQPAICKASDVIGS